jgi:hypothetical protein
MLFLSHICHGLLKAFRKARKRLPPPTIALRLLEGWVYSDSLPIAAVALITSPEADRHCFASRIPPLSTKHCARLPPSLATLCWCA